MDVYEDMAAYYDLIYCDTLDAEFYLLEAKNARGPVLEVACGTGRILLRLLAAGIDVEGVDLSPAMLAVLADKAEKAGLKPRVRVHVGDMRDFKLKRRFRLIIVPYRSFLHLAGDDRLKALQNFREHLEPGGRLILHTYLPSPKDLTHTGGLSLLDSEEIVSPDGKPYRIDWFLEYERKTSRAHFSIVLTLWNGESHTFPMDLYFFSVREMRGLLEKCGYRDIRAYCGFNYGPVGKDCKEVLWVAER